MYMYGAWHVDCAPRMLTSSASGNVADTELNLHMQTMTSPLTSIQLNYNIIVLHLQCVNGNGLWHKNGYCDHSGKTDNAM